MGIETLVIAILEPGFTSGTGRILWLNLVGCQGCIKSYDGHIKWQRCGGGKAREGNLPQKMFVAPPTLPHSTVRVSAYYVDCILKALKSLPHRLSVCSLPITPFLKQLCSAATGRERVDKAAVQSIYLSLKRGHYCIVLVIRFSFFCSMHTDRVHM